MATVTLLNVCCDGLLPVVQHVPRTPFVGCGAYRTLAMAKFATLDAE
jgi:hypothetical protein